MTRLDKHIREAAKMWPPPADACIAPEEFAAFYSDALPARRMDEIRSHLAGCNACLELADDMSVLLGGPSRTPKKRFSLAWPSFTWKPAFQAAAAAVLVLVIGVIWVGQINFRNRDAIRSTSPEQTMELLAPKGELQELPSVLQWRPFEAAELYEIEVVDSRFGPVWKETVRGNQVVIPDVVKRQLEPDRYYAWKVTAITPLKKVMSPFETFRVRSK